MSDRALRIELRAKGPIPLQVSLSVEPGELLVLVGPSGSGKSTILRTIAGLHRPQHGCISQGAASWLDTGKGICLSPQARRVGMVFQDYALFPHLSALENLEIGMDSGTRAERRERARALLARVRLTGLDNRRPAELSGGQQQRVAVARALARDPGVLLLDEPFSAVDMMTRQRLQRELAVLRRDIDIPIVLVTHDMQEAAVLGDRICVLHEGVTLQAAPPEVIFRQPASPHVARLIGGHNIFTGTLERMASGVQGLRWGACTLELASAPRLPDGSQVQWYIPESDIVLHRRGRPSLGEHENPVNGIVQECVPLGSQTSVILRCNEGHETLRLSVSTHAARRNGLLPEQAARVSLLASGIHLMPG